MGESLTLATIHDALLEFLRRRDDAVLFDAQAVNAYVDESRMTQDVDILSTRAAELAEELRTHLADRFHIAVRIRSVAAGMGFRIYQLREPKNRHLADIRQVAQFPPTQLIAEVRVLMPEELIAQKVLSCCRRHGQPKGDTDQRDLKMLLLAYPKLKSEMGPVMDRLRANGAETAAIEEWKQLVASDIRAEDSEEFN
jgi:hypothetical protein